MTRTGALTLLSVLLLAGCPTRPDDGVQGVAPKTPVPTADGGTGTGTPKGTAAAADAGADTGTTKGAVAILRITSPASNVSTNGTVAIAVGVDSGAAPTTIQLTVDGTALTTLSAPAPYKYSWDTTGVADGPHSLVAQTTVDGDLIASPPVTVVVDHTPPTILSTVPATGAINVVLRAPITVRFSEPILASSFTVSSLSLRAGGAVVPIVATLAGDGLSATIAISDFSSFALPASFSVVLAPTLTDLVGNAIRAPAAAWSWMVPDWIKYASVASTTAPALAVGPTFQPTLAYTRCLTAAGASSCTDDLFVATSDGQAWNSLGQVPALTGPGSLDLNAQGQPIVAGVGVAGSSILESVLLATWNGSSWDNSISPLGIDSTYAFTASPSVRLDSAGRPVVAWKDAVTATEADIGVARWTGTAWDRSFGKFGLTNANLYDLILDDVGNPVVGFNTIGTLVSLPSSSFRAWNGTTWTSSASLLLGQPFVAIDQASNPTMIAEWNVEQYSNGSWLAAISTVIPAGDGSGNQRITAGADHQPVVAWTNTAATSKVGLARWTGTEWNARAGLFSANGVVTSEAPGVLVDGRGSVWVFWREGAAANVWMSNY